jgi:predicted AAA+ superfamily ATPase
MENLLYQYNPWWEETFINEAIKPRDKYLTKLRKYLDIKQIIVLTGLRRVGKTTLMKLVIEEIINQGVLPKYILYLSLDDYLLHNNSIIEILNEYRKVHKIKLEEKIYLFFDEITYKENFHIQLKNIYDSQNAKIYYSKRHYSIP